MEAERKETKGIVLGALLILSSCMLAIIIISFSGYPRFDFRYYTEGFPFFLALFALSLVLVLQLEKHLTPLILTCLLIAFASAFVFMVPVTSTTYNILPQACRGLGLCCPISNVTQWESIGYATVRIGFHYEIFSPGC